MQCANDTSTAKRNVAWTGFSGSDGLFVCSEQKLISRFGKERLNNIWQAQVPPRSVQPSLPQWEGNLAAPGEAVPTLTGVIHSVSGTRWISWGCVWIHRFHAKKGTLRQATCKSAGNGLQESFSALCVAVTGMHTVNPSMMWHHSSSLQYVFMFVQIRHWGNRSSINMHVWDNNYTMAY